MAERWLYVYDSFSAEEQWGDPDNLRRSLDAAWNHLEGKKLNREEFQGVVAPTAKSPTGPVTVTNQWAFERYRSVIDLARHYGRYGA